MYRLPGFVSAVFISRSYRGNRWRGLIRNVNQARRGYCRVTRDIGSIVSNRVIA